MSSLFQPLEDIIRTVFIPTITGRLDPNDTDRDVFALPTRLGGLGLGNPAKQCDMQFSSSMLITKKLIESILLQDPEYSSECLNNQITAKALIKKTASGASYSGSRRYQEKPYTCVSRSP